MDRVGAEVIAYQIVRCITTDRHGVRFPGRVNDFPRTCSSHDQLRLSVRIVGNWEVGFRLTSHPSRRHDRKALDHIHGANHRGYCRYAAESTTANKARSQQGACLAKVEPRPPWLERPRVAIADVAEKIRFHMSFREELLLAGLTFASRKELLIEFCVVEA